MKKIVIMMVAILLVIGLLAQTEEIEEATRKTDEAMKKLDEAMEKLEQEGYTNYNVQVVVDDDGEKVIVNKSGLQEMDKPFLGITYSDLTLAEAAELGYKYFYGIRLTSVVHGSPAYYYRLRKGDILMSVNNDKIEGKDKLSDVISYYRVGEKVKLKVFREGEEMEIAFVFGTRDKVFDLEGNIVMDKTETGEDGEIVVKKKKIDYGDGTIAWMPTWYVPEVKDINQLLHGLGFEEETYSEDGLFLNGIGLKSHIGNGWLIGGQYTGYYNEKTTRHMWDHADIPAIGDSTQVERKAKYWIRYGGLSFDRRFIFSKKLYGELGCMLTWGMNQLKVSQTASADAPDYDFNDPLDEYLDNFYNISSSMEISNYGFMAEPRLSLGWRITDWLSFKAEAAYIYTVYMSGWEAKANDYDINIINKPDTNMDGLTLSIGPWFGF